MTDTLQDYGADSISALEGLEPVRLRPGMYIGSTGRSGLHHMLWEVVDNSVDEAMAGYADRVDIAINNDNSISVSDNGRGIPVAPQTKGSYKGMPTVEMVMTILHAGGKFGQGAYQFSGGLHGVGISVVNALSEWVRADVHLDGQIHSIKFAAVEEVVDGQEKLIPGKVIQPLEVTGKTKHRGTTITFQPDHRVFSATEWDYDTIARRIRQGAFLNPGLTFTLTDNRESTQTATVEYRYPNGLRDFMDELTPDRLEHAEKKGKTDLLMPAKPIVLKGEDTGTGNSWEMVFRWFPDQWYRSASFANGIETGHGGTHVKGYEQVLTMLMNRYARQDHIGFLGDRDSNLEAVDVRSGLGVIIAVKVRDPQFVGQTKDELSNDEVRQMVRQGFSEQFWDWMQDHPIEAKMFIMKCIEEMRMRHRISAMAEAERAKAEKKGIAAKSQPLPSKLSDCETRDRQEAELFIVEGNSAAGPTKKARDTHFQAVLPIRGKILNAEEALNRKNGLDRIQNNEEIQGILAAIGAGSQEMFDVGSMRYGKIVILTDADDDGAHIETLLMTAFYRMCQPLVDSGHLYVARPPLFSTVHKGEKVYVHDVEEREAYEAKHPRNNFEWTRFKGLGEMNYDQLAQTCISPETRRLAQINVEEASIADSVTSSLMGSDTDAKWEALQDVVIEAEEVL